MNAGASTDQKEIHSHGSQKSVVPKKKSANARLPLSCEVRGRRRESARPLTPVSGVAASAIRSKRNGENPIEGSCDRAGEDGTQVLGEREGGARGCERRGGDESASRREKKREELEDMREAREA